MIFVVVLLLAAIVLAFPFVRRDFKVIFVPTRRRDAERIRKDLNIGQADVVYDLGCGNGQTLAVLVEGTGAKGVGIEISPLWHAVAKASYRRDSNLRFIRASFFKTDFSDATVVYCFLIPGIWKNLAPKFKRELRPGTRVVSHLFPIDGWNPEMTIRNDKGFPCTFIYRI